MSASPSKVSVAYPPTESTHIITQFSCFCFSGFSFREEIRQIDVKIHSSEVKMYSADVKIQVKIGNHQIAI